MRNQKYRTPEPEIPWKTEKSRTLNVEVIYPSGNDCYGGYSGVFWRKVPPQGS